MDRMGANIGNSLKKRVRRRRRSHTRKIPVDGYINMAEVRREIVNALQLHRSSASTHSTTHAILDNEIIGGDHSFNNNNNKSCRSQYNYPLLVESIPVPEPIWSTTAPAVLSVPPAPGAGEIIEFEWPENVSSSNYTWWSSFLTSLDGKTSKQISNYSYLDNIMVENSKVYEQSPDGSNIEATDFDGNEQNPFPDEWLILPTAEDSS